MSERNYSWLFEELRGGFLTLFLLEAIARAESSASPDGDGLLHAPLVLGELPKLNTTNRGVSTGVGNGVYYARLKLLENKQLIAPRPVLNKEANKAVKAFVLTEEGKRVRAILLEETKRLVELVTPKRPEGKKA